MIRRANARQQEESQAGKRHAKEVHRLEHAPRRTAQGEALDAVIPAADKGQAKEAGIEGHPQHTPVAPTPQRSCRIAQSRVGLIPHESPTIHSPVVPMPPDLSLIRILTKSADQSYRYPAVCWKSYVL
jgi:hypothetical protein